MGMPDMNRQQLREKLIEIVDPMVYADGTVHKDDPRIDQLEHLIDEYVGIPDKVDRFEVIDDDGRAYVKGCIYGSPVKVELSYQDDGRTLKVFVSRRAGIGEK